MAYRSSVHESTGFTPQYLVFGQELSLPIDCMYPSPQMDSTISFNEYVYQRKQAFQRAYDLVRKTLNETQQRRNAIYNKRVHLL